MSDILVNMSLFISQKDDRSELQKQIAAELQRKIRDTSNIGERPDGVDDSQYIANTQTTGRMAGVWIIAIIIALAIITWLTVLSVSR